MKLLGEMQLWCRCGSMQATFAAAYWTEPEIKLPCVPHSVPRSCCILLLARKHRPSTSGLHSLIAKPLREHAKALGSCVLGK